MGVKVRMNHTGYIIISLCSTTLYFCPKIILTILSNMNNLIYFLFFGISAKQSEREHSKNCYAIGQQNGEKINFAKIILGQTRRKGCPSKVIASNEKFSLLSCDCKDQLELPSFSYDISIFKNEIIISIFYDSYMPKPLIAFFFKNFRPIKLTGPTDIKYSQLIPQVHSRSMKFILNRSDLSPGEYTLSILKGIFSPNQITFHVTKLCSL